MSAILNRFATSACCPPGLAWIQAFGVRWVNPAWDALIALSCFLILSTLSRLLRRRRDSAEAEGKREALARLADVEGRFRLFIEGVKEYAICRISPEGRVVTWNLGAERIKGYPAEEAIGMHVSRFYTPEDQEAGKPLRDLERAGANGSHEDEGWLVRKDGSRFFALYFLQALRDGDGRLIGFAKITKDITERKAAEARIQRLTLELERKVKAQGDELLESGAFIKGIIEFAPSAVALKGLDGRFLIVNPRMETLIGRPQAEILGRLGRELFPAEAAARVHDRDQQVMGLKRAVEVEEQWTHPDGSRHDYLSHVFPVVDTHGDCWGTGVIATDITDRKQADQAMVQTQKMECLGLLAGGVAHDFNNLLGAMQSNLDVAKRQQPADAPVREHLATLEGLVGSASYLVRQMFSYSGRGPFKVENLNLNQVVEEMIHLLRSSIARKGVIRYDPDPRLPAMLGDLSQVHQLVMNLVLNASEALGESGGVITIRTLTEHLGGPFLRTLYEGQGLEPGTYVALEVADTGVGMAPEIRSRIFDPFFTTKTTGRGLGLAAIQGIVRGHRGGIRVFSEQGRGSQFKVVLPAAGTAPAGPAEPAEELLDDFRGSGTVLVVDDEDGMRAAAVKLLNHLGFDTLQARDGLQALRLLDQHPEEVRLILMDLTMPNMDGEEVYRELRQRGIRTPVILSSGYQERDVLQRFRGQGLAGFLQKPYKYNVIVRMLREALPS